jgi:hypothetical protein
MFTVLNKGKILVAISIHLSVITFNLRGNKNVTD